MKKIHVFTLILSVFFMTLGTRTNASTLKLSNRVLRHESHQFPIYDSTLIQNTAAVSGIKLDTVILKSKKLNPPLATNETVYFVDISSDKVIAEAIVLQSSKNKKKAKAKFIRVHVDATRKQLKKSRVVRSIDLLGLNVSSKYFIRFGVNTGYHSQKNRGLDYLFNSKLEPRMSSIEAGGFIFYAFDLNSISGNEIGLEFSSLSSLPASLTLQQGSSLTKTKAKITQTSQSLDLIMANQSLPYLSKIAMIVRALETKKENINIEGTSSTNEITSSDEFKSSTSGARVALLLESNATDSIHLGLKLWAPATKKWDLETAETLAPIEGSVKELDLEAYLNLKLSSWLRITPKVGYHTIDFNDETNEKERHFEEAIASIRIDFELKF